MLKMQIINCVILKIFLCKLISRDGVGDTRLKAYDTKKSVAKAKDRPSQGQGLRTQAQVFSKKKVFK